MRPIILATALLAVLCSASSVQAESWDYANSGMQNAAAYSFTASADGLLKAYFMPSTGSYHSALGARVNGTIVGSGELPMGATDSFVPFTFGSVAAGDSIEFFIDAYDGPVGSALTGRYFSTVAHNADGLQHVWAAYHPDQWYLGPEGVPEGTFIGFEDTTTGDVHRDLNYRDYTFVVPNLTVATPAVGGPVPEPASWAMMIAGFGAIGAALRRRRALATA
jgi:hypothetical protein